MDNCRHEPDTPFKSDGCSGGMSWFWKTFLGKPPPWEDVCYVHDRAYWYGGSKEDRLAADKFLASQIKRRGHPIIAFLMYYAIRLAGMPHWNLSKCWNYGSKKKEYRLIGVSGRRIKP